MAKKKIVTIGGGTGSFVLLSGLKKLDFEISAIISTADSGGSGGRLRDELGVLPPGDFRQCLVALSEDSKFLRELINYRFVNSDLKGHTVGNVIISAAEKINGDFSKGIESLSKIFRIKGKIIPVSDRSIDLNMKLKNKKVLKSEEEIYVSREISKNGVDKIFLKGSPKASKRAIRAIQEADLIVIAPGNIYASVVPNLLVDGIIKAIDKSKAEIVYTVNLANKKYITDGFEAVDYINFVNQFLGRKKINYAIVNSKKPSKKLQAKYKKEGDCITEVGKLDKVRHHCQIVKTDILSNQIRKSQKGDLLSVSRSFVRHDSEKLAKVIEFITVSKEYQKFINKILK